MAKKTIKAFAIVGEQGHLAAYTEPAVHPFLIFHRKHEALGALWKPTEKVVPVQIIIDDK